ncbi:MAG: alpha/beta fold hydrolase [Pseudomonadota bacterium]
MDLIPAKRVTEGGTPLWVWGDGPPIILIHGVLADHRMWSRQVAGLKPHFKVCCLDMLGHGEAPDPPGRRSLQDFVDQVDETVDALSGDMRLGGDTRPALIGFSMGGLVAQAYAVQHHRKLRGLVLLNAVHDRSSDEQKRVWERYQGNVQDGVEHAVQSAVRRWFKPSDYEADPNAIEDTFAIMRDGDFAAKCKAHRVFVTADGEVTGKLGQISCPALVMTGAEDTGSTPAMARKMAAALPKSELHILEDQHHMMPVLDAARVNGILIDFINRLAKN